jgi:hypothetical protein
MSVSLKIEGLEESQSVSLSSPVVPTLEHRASVKCFVSLQFLNPKTVGRTPRTLGDQLVARPLSTQDNTNTEKTQIDIHALSGIRTRDPSVQASEDSALYCVATVIGLEESCCNKFFSKHVALHNVPSYTFISI